MKQKKGISLILLAVTIIVMIIIAGVVVLTITETDIIDQTKGATKDWDIATINEEIRVENLNRTSGMEKKYLDKIVNGTLTELGIEIDSKNNKLVIENEKLVYRPEITTEEEAVEFEAKGIYAGTYIGLVASASSKSKYKNSDNLITIDQLKNYTDKTIYLLENITVSDWTSLTEFTGTLIGNGYTISGINTPFITTNKGIIKSLTIDGNLNNYESEVAAFAVYNYGRIENCVNKAEIIAVDYSAGITGTNYQGGVIVNCCNKGYIKSDYVATGIVIENNGVLFASYNEGIVEGDESYGIFYASKLVGNLNIVKNCYNKGELVSYNTIAGLVAFGNNKMSNMYNIGNNIDAFLKYGIGVDVTGVRNCYSLHKNSFIDINQSGSEYNNYLQWIEDLATNVEDQKIELLNRLNQGNSSKIWVEDTNNINGGYPILYWQAE